MDRTERNLRYYCDIGNCRVLFEKWRWRAWVDLYVAV
jgi:hypothetical protein